MDELTNYQLIDGMINDLGNENNGVQVRGFRNLKIISTVVEALSVLKDRLQKDEDAVAAVLADKNDEIKKLRRQVVALGGTLESESEEPEVAVDVD